MDSLYQDLKFTFRTLLRAPLFSAVVVVLLALGIGANTAIFSLVEALILNPFPFPEPDRLVAVDAYHVSGSNSGTGWAEFSDWRKESRAFENLAIVPWDGSYTLTGMGEPQRVVLSRTTWGWFEMLRVQPVLGRSFTQEEDRPGAPLVALLSYQSWQQRFGRRPDILGQPLTLDGTAYTIIGVLPPGYALPGIRTSELWAPLRANYSGRLQHQYSVMARLRPGVSINQAQAEMSALAQRHEQAYPDTNKGWRIRVQPASEALAVEVRQPLAILMSAVGAVLLLVCANVAGLFLARASSRAPELAIRTSLGAGRARLLRQMLTESVVLATAGGLAGLAVAQWGIRTLRVVAPADVGLDSVLRLDRTVLLFALALSLLTGVVFGLAPALSATRTDLNTVIKGKTGGPKGGRTLASLVAVEVALSAVLLVCGGLLVKNLSGILRLDTGLKVEHVLTFLVDLPSRYQSPSRSQAFFDGLLARLRSVPQVSSAGLVSTLPMTSGYSGNFIEVEGRPSPADRQESMTQVNTASPGYFRSLGIPLLRGREFDERDTLKSPPVLVVNTAWVDRFLPGQDPVGRKVRSNRNLDWKTIVGVTGSFRHQNPTRLPEPMMYTAFAQEPTGWSWVAVRTTGDPRHLTSQVRGMLHELDADVPLLKVRTMSEVISESVHQQRLMSTALGGFALFALGLAAIGIYGVIAYSVSRRTHEIGIRVALGASRPSVLGFILRRGFLLAGVGLLAGLPLAALASGALASQLFGISPYDPWIYAGVGLTLLLATLAASYLPARRAARVDPLIALRVD